MKEYRKISFLIVLSLVSVVSFGQTPSQSYLYKTAPFNIDTIFKPVMHGTPSSKNYVWLNTLNGQYIDTTKNKINASAIPAYVPIKKNALTNPYSGVNQFIGAMLPYGYYFPPTQYGQTSYKSENRPYPIAPYGHTPYNLKASVIPYYILPKY